MGRRQQDELPVAAVFVEVEIVTQLIADLGREAGDVDVEIGELGLFAGEMLQCAIVPLDQRGAVDWDQVAEHEAEADEAVHWDAHQSLAITDCTVS